MNLQPQELSLVSYLQERWNLPFRLTTVQQAQVALGLPDDQAMRLRVGDYLLTHPEVHPVIQRWGARTVVLTEDEKLLARYLTQQARDGGGRVSLQATAAAVGCAAEAVWGMVESLIHLGLLTATLDEGNITYTCPANLRSLAGPLGFSFHMVTFPDGEVCNVP